LFDIQADCQVWLDNLPEGLKLTCWRGHKENQLLTCR
jgi:hypothetical protein